MLGTTLLSHTSFSTTKTLDIKGFVSRSKSCTFSLVYFYGLAMARIVLLHFPWLGQLAREGAPKAMLAFKGKTSQPSPQMPFTKGNIAEISSKIKNQSREEGGGKGTNEGKKRG